MNVYDHYNKTVIIAREVFINDCKKLLLTI